MQQCCWCRSLVLCFFLPVVLSLLVSSLFVFTRAPGTSVARRTSLEIIV